MLPFVFFDESKLGPFHAFGVMCALGFFAWDGVVMKHAARKGLDVQDFRVLTIWLLVMGTLVSLATDATFYHPPGHSIARAFFSMQGFSATGGFVGALAGAFLWRSIWIGRKGGSFRVRLRQAPMKMMAPTEVIVATWPVAFAIGRLGCALVHDHPGITVAKGSVASLFALAWPLGPDDGTHHVLGALHVVTGGSAARFDLGLLEAAFLGVLAVAFARTWKKDVAPWSYTIAGCLLYGTARFFLDFLRMEDGPAGELRHGGLTFAQYWSLGVVALGAFLVARPRPTPAALEEAE